MTLIPPYEPDRTALHQEWLDHIKDEGVNLTVAEEDFIESIDERLTGGRRLTDKQAAWLEDIYTKRVP
jgi:hypothetical protein